MLRLGDILYPMANLDQVNPNQMDLDQLTNLDEVNLNQLTNLDEANLDEANLDKANLDEANLDEVNLDQLTNLDETNLQHQAPIIRGLYLIFAQPVVSCPDLF